MPMHTFIRASMRMSVPGGDCFRNNLAVCLVSVHLHAHMTTHIPAHMSASMRVRKGHVLGIEIATPCRGLKCYGLNSYGIGIARPLQSQQEAVVIGLTSVMGALIPS